MARWTKEFPTTEGSYWFYGSMWGGDNELTYIKCTPIPNSILYVAKGAIVYKKDLHGVFMPLLHPSTNGVLDLLDTTEAHT